ncbi:putative oxidoreductase SadH [Hartmannibacter diazotrophicus]|uniref:Putative oxidoreductase SadH n=1 Tax=Hartmannibacter diazotrophicus TaxID=1482074 RepID=A0A2C9D4E3_9HYPH|nr:SDR family NAD(P)-dependent oxidoreductase [Hartmannibacter diazotrophicus]SON55182.1 putative oxidoreductase SadH [Hartmannibacter diazotrophicus]
MSKTWFITGAARGFGRLWAEGALTRGDRVAVSVRNPDAIADLVTRFGELVLPLRLDVTDRDAVFEAVASAHRHFGRLDVILSNAGYGLMGAVEETSFAEMKAIFETNVFGTISLVQAALPFLRQQGSGHILPVSSLAGLVAVPTAGIYEATKFAIEGFAEALAAEVGAFGVRTTIIEPGAYATDFLSGTSLKTAAPMAIYNKVRDDLAQMLTAEMLGDPAATWPAIAHVVDFENPPLRLILGDNLSMLRQIYGERMKTWETWEDVSKAAQGSGRA